MRTLIIIGGFVWLAGFVFHVFFWRLFDWKRDLGSLTKVNRAIMQVLNLSLMLVFLIFAYISIFQTDELLTTGLGRTLLVGMVLFGIFRTLEQVIFFDLRPFLSKLFMFFVIVGTTLYLIPLIFI